MSAAAGAFRVFAEACPHRVMPSLERRPGNALCVEIGAPAARCRLKAPPSLEGLVGRWLASGGSALVLGPCSRSGCALGHRWCRCGHRFESHLPSKRGRCAVGGCGCDGAEIALAADQVGRR